MAMMNTVADAMLAQLPLSKRRSVEEPAQPLFNTARQRPLSSGDTSASNHRSSSARDDGATSSPTRATTTLLSGQPLGAVHPNRNGGAAARAVDDAATKAAARIG